MKIKDLHPDSKLWLYQSDRELSSTEIQWLNEQLETFAFDWASHGTNLKAAAQVINPYFIALAVDLTQVNASGCSIDTSVRFVKDLGKKLNVNFFNRLKIWVKNKDEKFQLLPFKNISEFPLCYMYNPLLQKLSDLHTKFEIPVSTFLMKN